MGAPKGNKYWHFRNKHGRDHKYTPELLWDEGLKYFKWIEDNPLMEEVTIPRGIKKKDKAGKETTEYFTSTPKMRAMTVTGFCLFADIDFQTYENYRSNKDFIEITTRIDKIIYSQKFEGAAAALLNPNIIARDLGLAEHSNNVNTQIIKVKYD